MQNTTITPRQRPLGVMIIAILAALQGVALLILNGIGFVGFLAAFSTNHASPLFLSSHAIILGAVLLILAVLSLLVARGLWTLKRWAFWFTVIVQILSLLSSIGMLIQMENVTTTTTTSNIVFALIILIYLFADKNVRAAFRI